MPKDYLSGPGGSLATSSHGGRLEEFPGPAEASMLGIPGADQLDEQSDFLQPFATFSISMLRNILVENMSPTPG